MRSLLWFVILLTFLAVPPRVPARQLPPPPGAIPLVDRIPFALAHVGQMYRYQIYASDATSFAAARLPAGLNVDAASGLISGVPRATGTFPVALSAIDSYGTSTISLTLTVGPELPAVDLKVTRPLVVTGSGGHGAIRISRTGDLTQALTVSFLIQGSAVNGTDYQRISDTLEFAPDHAAANLRIIPTTDVAGEGVKTCKLVLLPGSTYQIGPVAKAKVKIVPGN